VSTVSGETAHGTRHPDDESGHARTGEDWHRDSSVNGQYDYGHRNHRDHADGNGHGTRRFGAEHARRLLSDERTQSFPPEAALRNGGVGTGMTVIDLGCGPRSFTVPARTMVGPAGHVIAADIQPEMLDHLHGRLDAAGITAVGSFPALRGMCLCRTQRQMSPSAPSFSTRQTSRQGFARSARAL
jgi:hypothetical protein